MFKIKKASFLNHLRNKDIVSITNSIKGNTEKKIFKKKLCSFLNLLTKI
jgi:hypothetical protein